MLTNGVEFLTALGLIASVFGLIAVICFTVRRPVALKRFYPVTILRPLCGDEPGLEEALASCCRQSYPTFQLVLGVQDPADPALLAVRQVQKRFPQVDIAVVIDTTRHGSNRKVANLINMLPVARHDLLVISDSDLHVPSDYLDRLVSTLAQPGTGLVTATYVGRPAISRWPERLGATLISHSFLPGFLLGRAMGRRDCLGSTVALWRDTLEQSGGLRALSDCVAEDNVLGRRVGNLGLTIRLADTVPCTTVSETSLPALWSHEMRWVRTMRSLAPLALGASTVQYPLFWATACVALSGGGHWAVLLFAGTWLVRAVSALGIDRALRRRFHHPGIAVPIFLLPIRDVLAVVEIAASYLSNTVSWRGHLVDVE